MIDVQCWIKAVEDVVTGSLADSIWGVDAESTQS